MCPRACEPLAPLQLPDAAQPFMAGCSESKGMRLWTLVVPSTTDGHSAYADFRGRVELREVVAIVIRRLKIESLGKEKPR